MNIVIIGAGIGGVGAANILAEAGHKVTVLEKNSQAGGRVSSIKESGYTFDTGPTWYLMPDVIERYFRLLGVSAEDELKLHRLDPTYRVFFRERKEPVDVFADREKGEEMAEALEEGGGEKLRKYLRESARLYDLAINRFLFRNYRSLRDLLSPKLVSALPTLHLLSSVNKKVTSSFQSSEMQKILEYTTVFIGSSPYTTPALYTFMSHIDFGMGAFYPEGGMYSLIRSLQMLGERRGVRYRFDTSVQRIKVVNGKAVAVILGDGEEVNADVVLSNADILHTETALLEEKYRSYRPKYWKSRTLAPSAFVIFLGIKKKLHQLRHHTLLFSEDWKANFADIFDSPKWPDDPSLYICAASRTDLSLAPDGCEGLFVLVPIAAGLSDGPEERKRYRDAVINLLEERLDEPELHNLINYEKIVGPSDYLQMYNSPKGTAFGFAHTINQTVVFRPKNKSRKVKNLYYAGAGTHPGIGLAPCLVSAELAVERILKDQKL